jgi:hypothetical protein
LPLHGGIGFTWEHEAHRYFKRAKTSQLLLGTPGELRRLIAPGRAYFEWMSAEDKAGPAGARCCRRSRIGCGASGYLLIVSVSSVTAAVRASALPFTVTPVVTVIEARAMMFPLKEE